MNGKLAFDVETLADATAPRHLPAVEEVIAAMHRPEDSALSLGSLAEMANLSLYHFARTFRRVTGIPPGEFLTAVRLERAKRLLLSTDLRVAEIAFEVGYESVGTFSTRFSNLVGLPPGRVRHLPEQLNEALDRSNGWHRTLPIVHPEGGVAFRVDGSALTGRLIFAGLFPTAVPQGRPVAGTILAAPGSYRLGPVPDGCYYLMAAALPCSEDPWQLLAPGEALRVGRARQPVVVRRGRAEGLAEVTLRLPRPTDPPVLVALPAILLDRLVPGSNHR